LSSRLSARPPLHSLDVRPEGEEFMRLSLASIALIVTAGFGALLDLRGIAGEPPAPARLEFERRLLDGSDIGVLFPTFADFDGDGKIDLLVGVKGLGKGRLHDKRFGDGGLLVYLNRGSNARPIYAKPFWFDDMVPSGLIPQG